MPILNSNDRASALIKIARNQGIGALPLLADAAQDDPDAVCRLVAIRGLGRIHAPNAEAVLQGVLDSSADQMLIIESMKSLSQVGSERAIPRIGELTTSEDKSIRVQAASALVYLPLISQSADAFRSLLDDPLVKLRFVALKAVALSENPEHRALVNERLKGESFTIKAIFAFARMLQRLSRSNV